MLLKIQKTRLLRATTHKSLQSRASRARNFHSQKLRRVSRNFKPKPRILKSQ